MDILSINIQAFIFGKLDAPSVLMVCIVLLIFIVTWGINRISILRIRKSSDQSKEISSIMQHTLDIGNSYVVCLDVRRQHAHNIHGHLLPEDGMDYQESFEMIHPNDRKIYREFVTRLVKEGRTSDNCIFRWDISGRKHLQKWRYMHDQGAIDISNKGANIFCTITDVTDQVNEENTEKEMTSKYRKMFEQSIIGLAFYDKDGKLLTANQKMREILNFQSNDDPFYIENTIYDMPTFREVLNNRHIQELFFCTKSVIIERGVNCYTEMHVHPIYDEQGELVYITFSIRDVTQERELYLQNKENDLEIRQINEEITEYENELLYLMSTCNMRFFRISLEKQTCTFFKSMAVPEQSMTIDELREHFVEGAFKDGLSDYEHFFSVPRTDLTYMHPFFHENEELQWNFIDSVPTFDEKGHMTGTYGIVRNVTALIEKQEQLKRETERANLSGMMKSTFMANMTHEIRTPLNAIVGFSDVLPMLSTPEEKQEIIRVIMNNCDMLMRLINDILAVSALDGSNIRIQPIETDFAKDFNDMCMSLAQRVQTPGVEFIANNPYTTLVTNIDKERILQVLTNFVTNAVKYTNQGHIKVGYEYRETEDSGLYLYCEDTGSGIAKEDQAKVFERFVKLNDYVQGTGLGLNISKAIAESCKGDIGVNSEGEGKGCTFWVWIPCKATIIK